MSAHVASRRTWPGGSRDRRLAADTIRRVQASPFSRHEPAAAHAMQQSPSAAAAQQANGLTVHTQLVPLGAHEVTWHGFVAAGVALASAVSPADFSPASFTPTPPAALALEPPQPMHPRMVTLHLDPNEHSYQPSPLPLASAPSRSGMASPCLPAFNSSPIPPCGLSSLSSQDSQQPFRALSSPTTEYAFPDPTYKGADSIGDIQLTPFQPSSLGSSGPRHSPVSLLDISSLPETASAGHTPYLHHAPSPVPRSDAESAGSTSSSSAEGLVSHQASPKPFQPSSFFMDAVASPSPTAFDSEGMQWNRMQDEGEAEDEAEEDEDEELEEHLPLDQFTSSNPHLDESVGSIGDVSMHPAPSTDGHPASSYYHPILLQEEFAGVRMHDENMQHEDEKTTSQRNARRKQLAIATKEHNVVFTTPVLRPKRLAARRNSEVVQATATLQLPPSGPHSIIPAPGMLQASPTVIPVPADTVASAHRPSHKRKSLQGENDKVDSTAECEQCTNCAECAKHWQADLKHDRSHGHVHPKPSAPNSPLVVSLQQDTEQLDAAPMLISPAHASTPQSPSKNHRNSNNGGSGYLCCKPNFAVRSGVSLNDSPKHTSLALGPAFLSKRQHHKMMHGHAYEVSNILDVRMRRGAVYYLVSWKGFPDIFNSWEPSVNLEKNCLQLLEQFEEENGKIDEWATEDADDDEHLAHESDDELDSCVDVMQQVDAQRNDLDDDDHHELASPQPPPPTLFAAHTHSALTQARPSPPLRPFC